MPTKKSTKKEVVKTVEVVENNENKIEVENIEKDINKIEEAINNVDLNIMSNTEETLANLKVETEEMLKPLGDISAKINVLETTLDERLATVTPENVETVIKEEIKKAEELKKDIEKINNKYNPLTSRQMTNWWNGMGYDM